MKTSTILLGLLLAAGALASLPNAQAMQAPPIIVCVTEPCPGPVGLPDGCDLEQATPAAVRTTLWGTDAGCDVDVEGPEMICAPPSSTGIDQTVGPVHVDAAVCDGGIPDRVCCLIALASADLQPPIYCVMAPCPGPYPPSVSYCTLKAATPEPLRTQLWGTDYGCDVDVDTTDIYTCAPPSGFVIDRTAGPLHVVLLVCDGGAGDLLCCITTTAAAAQPPIYCVMAPCGPCTCPPPVIDLSPCRLEMATPAQVRTLVWGTDAGCDIDVETNWYCLYDGVYVDRTVGFVHVETIVCTPPMPPIEAAA